MERPRLVRRHRLDRSWTKAGGHIPRLRCSWEDRHARIGVKGHKWVAQGKELNMEDHLHRMKTNEVVEVRAHSERGRDVMDVNLARAHNRCSKAYRVTLLRLLGDRAKAAVKDAENEKSKTLVKRVMQTHYEHAGEDKIWLRNTGDVRLKQKQVGKQPLAAWRSKPVGTMEDYTLQAAKVIEVERGVVERASVEHNTAGMT
eukprot:932090-Heterocapsa_arctica.AAC.1